MIKMRAIVRIVLWMWQMPQNIVGMILWLYYRGYILHTDVSGVPVGVYFSERMRGGISLGQFVFVPIRERWGSDFVRHEVGHCRQSQYLGWFYLIIVGLPSIIWAWLHRYMKKSYYWFYTERWADKLGGVER